MLLEKRLHHNYNNLKVAKWIVKNTSKVDWEECHDTTGICYQCSVYKKYSNLGRDLGYHIKKNGIEVKYYDQNGKIDTDVIISEIKNLTDREKRDLVDMEQVWIYLCPECGQWAMDGADI